MRNTIIEVKKYSYQIPIPNIIEVKWLGMTIGTINFKILQIVLIKKMINIYFKKD
jgi:hypothetical protein